jgi:hypothetical protein
MEATLARLYAKILSGGLNKHQKIKITSLSVNYRKIGVKVIYSFYF